MLKLINDEEIIAKDTPVEVVKSEDEIKVESTLKNLTVLSKQVIGKLNKDDVPPTPENYKIYFDAHLETKPEAQRKEIAEILALEAEVEADHTATLEKDIQNAFIYVKSMTESIAIAYTKINQLKKITVEKRHELETNHSPLALVSYQEDLEMVEHILEKEAREIKSRYNSTSELIRHFNQSSIYDKKYGVYNKKFLIKALDSILKSVEKFEHQNTLLSIKIKPSSLANIQHQKDRMMINITLSKLLLKRSRRSDIIGHYDDNVFIIVLKHTDKKQAQIAIDRINDMIESANFIVDTESIDVALNFGLASIDKSKSKEEILIEAIDDL